MSKEIELEMTKVIERLMGTLSGYRTGRANPELLVKIMVDYYGSKVPLQQVASISVPEPMVLMINVFDQNAIKDVESAIMSSDLSLTPQTDGNIIRLRLPDLTEERRKELVKLVRKSCEDSRVVIRNVRRDFLDKLKGQEKNKEISEDELKSGSDEIQKVTDSFVSQVDEILKEKDSEIMHI